MICMIINTKRKIQNAKFLLGSFVSASRNLQNYNYFKFLIKAPHFLSTSKKCFR